MKKVCQKAKGNSIQRKKRIIFFENNGEKEDRTHSAEGMKANECAVPMFVVSWQLVN